MSRARMTRGRVLEQTFLRIAFRFHRKEGGQAWSDHRLRPERVSRGHEALHLIVAPRHRDSNQNMITGALQADIAHIMVPADGNFTTVIAIDDHKAGEIQGQRLDRISRLITLRGMKHICIPTDLSAKTDSVASLHQGGILRQPGGQHMVQVRSRDIHVPHQGG